MKNSQDIRQMFDNIANDYDKMNNLMTFNLQKVIKRDVLSKIKGKNCSEILDLCTGTGDMAIFALKTFPNSKITAIDFSEKMLELARKRSNKINFIEGDCTKLPFADNCFDVCMISFGLRNIPNMESVISEIFRVLKSGGIFVNIDLGKPNKFFNVFLKPYMYLWVAILGKIFHGDETPYKYLAKSNELFPSPDELVKIYAKLGFKNSEIFKYFFGQVSAQISQK